MITVGVDFPRRLPVLPPEPQPPTVDELRDEQILAALAALREALLTMPAPVVNVDAPDLSAIVGAVVGLKPNVDADDIATAVVSQLGGTPQPEIEPVLAKLVDALKRLDFRLQGITGSGRGGGASSTVRSEPGTWVDVQDAQTDTRYEWQLVGGASHPLYVGSASPGTATSMSLWRIQKYTYATGPDGEQVPVLVQTQTGAWDLRTSMFGAVIVDPTTGTYDAGAYGEGVYAA